MKEAKTLMIGDWVYHLPNIPTKINSSLGLYHIEGNEDAYKPIPLTPEILAKNGINGGLWEDFYGHTLLVKNNRIKYFFDGHRRLDLPYNRVIYVHELQHALRLCGLVKLADSFKVD